MEDKKIKNKIITISGEPVSGKGTAVKLLVEKLKEQGYKENQIHLQCTGDEFRKYFSNIVEFVKNFNNPQKFKDIVQTKEIQDFLKSKSYRQLLINTIIDLKKSNIDLSKFKIEQANNMEEFSGVRAVVDTLIDRRMKIKGEQINQEEHPDDIWIIDSRLAFENIPEAYAVRLTANPKVAGERLFNDKSRGAEDSKYDSVEDAIREREARKEGEKERYLERYNVNLEEESNYDLIIDTSYSTVEDIANVILECTNCYYNNQEFSKKWASPKIFLPLQSERETYGATFGGNSLEELAENIKTNGYYPESCTEVIEVDEIKYIIEGHHRNFASAYLGKTLIPYETIAKDDELIPGTKTTARKRANGVRLSDLYGHEDMIKNFSYEEIYPGIYNKIKQQQEQGYVR